MQVIVLSYVEKLLPLCVDTANALDWLVQDIFETPFVTVLPLERLASKPESSLHVVLEISPLILSSIKGRQRAASRALNTLHCAFEQTDKSRDGL